MPLVEPEHYGWREAVDIVAKKQPGEGAVKSLIDAHARGAAKSSVVDSKGKPREVPAEYWWLLKIAWEKYPPLTTWQDKPGAYEYHVKFDLKMGTAEFKRTDLPYGATRSQFVKGAIRVDRAKLDELLNPAEAEEDAPEKSPPEQTSETPDKGGRPPDYEWDKFADAFQAWVKKNGFPKTHGLCLADMRLWCETEWGRTPPRPDPAKTSQAPPKAPERQ